MVARRWLTTEGDYEIVLGRPRADSTMASAVLLRFRMRRGSCPVAPTLGSRFHTIRHVTPSTGRLLESYAREAVADLLERGDIRDWKATGTAERDRVSIVVSFRDRAGVPGTVTFTRRVGG